MYCFEAWVTNVKAPHWQAPFLLHSHMMEYERHREVEEEVKFMFSSETSDNSFT